MSVLRPVPASACTRSRWKNDGGWTTEIARRASVDVADAFDWRISIAQIEADGPFSGFPGIERDLLLLDGNGIELDIGDTAPVRLQQRFERVHFAGESPVHCRLLAGPTRDFNVMARRDRVRADVVARPLVGSMLIFGQPDSEWLVHALAGNAEVRAGDEQVRLGIGDSLVADFSAGACRMLITGGGELVLVHLERIEAS